MRQSHYGRHLSGRTLQVSANNVSRHLRQSHLEAPTSTPQGWGGDTVILFRHARAFRAGKSIQK